MGKSLDSRQSQLFNMSIFDLNIIQISTQIINRMFNPYIILLDQYNNNGSNYSDEVKEVHNGTMDIPTVNNNLNHES